MASILEALPCESCHNIDLSEKRNKIAAVASGSVAERIHDILGWIRIWIRIRGSMPLTNGSGPGSCYFCH
jgi:hypothetical protein